MKYIEWKNELESYLLDLPDDEKRKVFSYFSEMYADKREAGFSEDEIIAEFGAPYDAAQRILGKSDEEAELAHTPSKKKYESNKDKKNDEDVRQKGDNSFAFVIICIIFAVPLFALIMSMVGITVGFCVAPIAMIISGFAAAGNSIGAMVASGAIGSGICGIGAGLIVTGLGFMLITPFFGLVKLMWQALVKLCSWVKNVFTGRNNV